MKAMQRILGILLAVLLVLPACAFAAEDILREGDSGERVRNVQARLIELGYETAETDGVYGSGTAQAVTLFQRLNDLMPTGMVDEITWQVLFSNGAERYRDEEEFAFYEYEDGLAYESGAMYATDAYFIAPAGAVEYDDFNTNEFGFFQENRFLSTATAPLSTFAADVDTASYALLRRLILNGEEVPADAVRIEEMLNYFRYDYEKPRSGEPFGVTMQAAPCPWNPETKLLLIGLQAEEVAVKERRPQNLVFLIDVSGSMDAEDKLPLVKRAFLLLLDELDERDTVSIVVYASQDRVVLDGVPASEKTTIMQAINDLTASGSTNGSAGIITAYELAEKHFVQGGNNRILLATDGDLNVGTTSEGDLARLVMEKKKAGVRLTMLGVGYGNYKDNKLEALADYGDGNYYYLDTIFEARRALVTEAGGTMLEVARDVKLQLDFNPDKVSAYRLIGYEDRVMDARDFADDTKDGGEVGSGHRVTALYEIVPAGSDFDTGVPASRYAGTRENGTETAAENAAADWFTLAIRYKAPGADTSTLEEYPFRGEVSETLSDNMKWAAAVAECAMLLRGSEFKGNATCDSALELARSCQTVSGDPYKEEFVYLLTLLQRAEK